LKVQGGKWQKFGQTAWIEKIPESAADFVNWKRGTVKTGDEIPVDMTFAIYDPKANKVIGFSES